jgi:fatty-acyl-CoA synthase
MGEQFTIRHRAEGTDHPRRHNIDSATIEESIYKMPGVKMAAAVGRPDAHAGEVPVAYVEVSQESGLEESLILKWARDHIGERAAVPKEVIIVESIPLTAVGKIFKPALRWDAIRRAYAKELEALGSLAASVQIEVGEDKVHGTSAVIRIRAAEGVDTEIIGRRVSELLARCTVHYDLAVVQADLPG